MTEALRRAADVGPFFSVRTGGGNPREDGFRPLAEVYGTPAALAERVEPVAARLGTTERRVAASLVHQGLAGRIWSLALAPAVLTGQVPDLAPAGLWWHPGRSAPDELRFPAPAPLPGRCDGPLPERLRTAVLHGHLEPLLHTTRAVARVAPGLLWGNAASALVGALRVLHAWCLGAGLPDAARRSVALAASLLDDPLLRGAGTLDPRGPSFIRRSCCLYYRVPGGGLCGDCCLRSAAPVPGR
ncbi:(2Fe-2S)-binding protein [Streptomyces meridianus]|uniref:(2Fe-2S)-binding protein n=1 Tax=Streptomyces meridianus TaxID=2938945 RepID=A0ABT0X6C3_9ACTN|nr:(2Fe-2S)-binding protein [Streptomyces meridianus]